MTKMLAVIPILTFANLPPVLELCLLQSIHVISVANNLKQTIDYSSILKLVMVILFALIVSRTVNIFLMMVQLLSTIMINHGLQYLYTCYKCDETFATHNLLASHVQTFHCKISWVTCEICLSIVQTSEEHNVHVELFHPYPDRNHVNDESVYGCHLCEKIFTTSSYLQDHMRLVHALVGDTIPQTDGNETLGDSPEPIVLLLLSL